MHISLNVSEAAGTSGSNWYVDIQSFDDTRRLNLHGTVHSIPALTSPLSAHIQLVADVRNLTCTLGPRQDVDPGVRELAMRHFSRLYHPVSSETTLPCTGRYVSPINPSIRWLSDA